MLNKDALQQLSQLKTNLHSEKDLAQGLVRATSKRFGFVRLDDGRDAFLEPDAMARVLPGDRVEVSLSSNRKDQLEATLEKLLESPLEHFVGRYTHKGQNHFVVPDLPPFQRWLFVPPQERTNCADGDLVECQVIRHPFKYEGRAQIRILKRIGKADEPGVEGRYIVAKHRLPTEWPESVREQTQAILQAPPLQSGEDREDLTHLPFVTIDSENTRDMDDAVHIAPAEAGGWQLDVAIADPGHHIELGSPLERTARERASTAYLLGHPITMLPTELSHDTFSLMPGEPRPTLVCRMHIDAQGDIRDYRFHAAIIRSRHKLSYQGVSDALEGDAPDARAYLDDTTRTLLEHLRECTFARIDYRKRHALVMEDRADYFFVLNEHKKIERVEKRVRTLAHRMVEEAMLATNICAGLLFREHPGQGLFSTHVGFRPERLDEVASLLKDDKPGYDTDGDLTRLADFQQLLSELRLNPEGDERFPPLLSALQRMLQAGSLSSEHRPHFGLGLDAYATVTSPIRRYHDLYNQYAIKRILRGEASQPLDDDAVAALQKQLHTTRQACRQLEQWLACQYMQERVGSVYQGTVTLVNANGIGVRLDDNGIEGYALLVDKRTDPKPAFDARRLTLTVGGATYRLDQKVMVVIRDVDPEKRRIGLEVVDERTAERLKVWTEPGSTDSQ